jgi:hypothetical protein
MKDLEEKLENVTIIGRDIWEHLPYLENITRECTSVLECGVRSVISTWAFLHGLVNNNSKIKRLTSCDIEYSNNVNDVNALCKKYDVKFSFIIGNDLHIPMIPYDLIFIDTWHIYGHLRRELSYLSPYAKKYIILHDTEVDKIQGESIRMGQNLEEASKQSGYTIDEVSCGLQKAVDEFLVAHPEWKIKEHFINCNGLTVLERLDKHSCASI